MRINGVSVYSGSNVKLQNSQKKQINNRNQDAGSCSTNPSFQGNAGKIIGGIAGVALMCVVCPALVGIGLGGIGALGGAMAGAVIDDKIEEKEDEKNDIT